MKYGDLPVSMGLYEVNCPEMMFYQDLPIKMAGETQLTMEDRLKVFEQIIGVCYCDFIGVFGLDMYVSNYVYVTAKRLYQAPGCPFNRPGYHSDGFLTDDINYIWCDSNPTVFNKSSYALTMHHEYSLSEMDQQSLAENEVKYKINELLRLNQFNIHKVGDITIGMRTFLKVSFSSKKYNLIGNSRNHLINYQWEMKARQKTRNHPIK
jgi:hypothetical protein